MLFLLRRGCLLGLVCYYYSTRLLLFIMTLITVILVLDSCNYTYKQRYYSKIASQLPSRCDVPIVSYDALQTLDVTSIIESAFGSNGCGILAVSNVPKLQSYRQDLLPLAHTFSHLPMDIKNQYTLPSAYYSFGWSHGKESVDGQPDYAKGSYYNNPISNDPTIGNQELITKYPSFYHPNIWPTKEIPQLESAFMKLGQLIVHCGHLVMQQCDTYIKSKCPAYEKGKLYQVLSTSTCPKARLLYYFPKEQDQLDTFMTTESSFSWCGWHNDHGALTGLVQAMYMNEDGEEVCNLTDPYAGLYVKDRGGNILQTQIPPDHLIYQIGETSQLYSGGILQATPHSVQSPRDPIAMKLGRATMAVFMQPEPMEIVNIPSTRSMEQATITSLENKVESLPLLKHRYQKNATYNEFTNATYAAYY